MLSSTSALDPSLCFLQDSYPLSAEAPAWLVGEYILAHSTGFSLY